MTGFEELQGSEEGQLGRAGFFPLFFNRRVSFRINALLCATSFTESSVDVGDR